LELLTTNILDPLAQSTYDESKYIISFSDAFSGYTKLYAIENKNDAAKKFAGYHKYLTNKFPELPVVEIRPDKAKEYILGEFDDYCQAAGILTDEGNSYSSELRGISERKNRTVLALMRALLEDAGMELGLWPLTISTVELIINCTFTKSNNLNLTPHEVLYGTPPELSNLRIS